MKSPIDKAQRLFDAAIQAEDEGNLSKALRLYKKAVEIDKNAAHPVVMIASILRDQNQWKEAIEASRKAIKRQPDSLGVHIAYSIIGDGYYQQGQLLRAEHAYRQALANEQASWVWFLLGDVLLRLDREDESIVCLQNALKVEPDYDEIHYNLGVRYRLRGQYNRAEKHLHKAIEIDPDYSLAYAELGWTLLQHRKGVRDKIKATEGIRLLNKSIKLNPNYGWSRVYLANALLGQRKLKAAEEQYRKVIELLPDESLSYWIYGSFLADQGINDTLAEEYLRKAVELDSTDSVANYYLGKHLHYWDRDTEAIKFLKKALKQGEERAAKILRKIELQSQKNNTRTLSKIIYNYLILYSACANH
jgi:tetratricopeptide (TPR) repeat protein